MQAVEDALKRKHSEVIIAAAVALAAVVSVESPFIHVDSIQVHLTISMYIASVSEPEAMRGQKLTVLPESEAKFMI